MYEPSVRTWEGTTERRVRAVVVLAAAGVGRKEVERESVMADDVASPSSVLSFLLSIASFTNVILWCSSITLRWRCLGLLGLDIFHQSLWFALGYGEMRRPTKIAVPVFSFIYFQFSFSISSGQLPKSKGL